MIAATATRAFFCAFRPAFLTSLSPPAIFSAASTGDSDYKEVASAAHAIKGAALMLSLSRLSAAAKAVELSGKALNGDPVDNPPSDAELEDLRGGRLTTMVGEVETAFDAVMEWYSEHGDELQGDEED